MKAIKRLTQTALDACSYQFNFDNTPPNQIILFITSLCNFACETCFYADKLNDTSNDLSFEEIEKISCNFRNIRLLLLTGGEPYLRKEMTEIVKLFYYNNNARRLHLPTNGYSTKKIISDTEKMLIEMPDLEINIGVSLDGLHEMHDKSSKHIGAFDKAIQTQRQLIHLEKKYSNLRTKFYVVVSNSNVAECDGLFRYIEREFGYEKIGFSPLRGDPANASLSPPSVGDWDELYSKYKHYQDDSSKPFNTKQFLINRKIHNLHSINKRILSGGNKIAANEKNFVKFKCSAGNNICTIDADGEVRVCELKDPIGNLRNHDYDIRKILDKRFAHDCSCTHACFQNASIDINPFNYIKQFI